MSKYKNLLNYENENFKVIKRVGSDKNDRALWKCLCKNCGDYVILTKRQIDNKKSCGCVNARGKHHMSETRIYGIWVKMRQRCNCDYDSAYSHYGGRGIKVCDEWDNSFLDFYNWAINNGYSDDLTIDRINFDGNYEPSNCRWCTMEEQANNRSNSKMITYNGETKTMAQWCKELNLNYIRVKDRLSDGWTFERAISTPVQANKRNMLARELHGMN